MREDLIEVAFKIDNCTWHPMFSPIIFLHWPNWEEFFERIRTHNPTLHKAIIYFQWRYWMDPRDTFANYASGDRNRIKVRRHNPKAVPAIIAYCKHYCADYLREFESKTRTRTKRIADRAKPCDNADLFTEEDDDAE